MHCVAETNGSAPAGGAIFNHNMDQSTVSGKIERSALYQKPRSIGEGEQMWAL